MPHDQRRAVRQDGTRVGLTRAPYLIWLAAVLVLVALPGRAQDTALQRLLAPEALTGWQGVGRVNVQGSGFCTGVLIAPDLVLTAAHCLYHKVSRRRIANDRVHFVAGWQNGRFAAHARAQHSAVLPGYDFNAADKSRMIALDLALIELRRPVPEAAAGPFAVARAPGTALSVVSYGEGRAQVPSLQSRCTRLPGPADIVVMSCDVTFGASGAPVFVQEDGDVRVMGIVSAMARAQGRDVALAVPLADTLARLLKLLGRSSL